MSETSKFVAKHGPSTLFTYKLFTEPSEKDLVIIKTGMTMHVNNWTHRLDSFNMLYILEEVDEEMAELIQDYRGFILNIVIPFIDEEIVQRFYSEVSYSLNFLKLKHEPMGFSEVTNNV